MTDNEIKKIVIDVIWDVFKRVDFNDSDDYFYWKISHACDEALKNITLTEIEDEKEKQ